MKKSFKKICIGTLAVSTVAIVCAKKQLSEVWNTAKAEATADKQKAKSRTKQYQIKKATASKCPPPKKSTTVLPATVPVAVKADMHINTPKVKKEENNPKQCAKKESAPALSVQQKPKNVEVHVNKPAFPAPKAAKKEENFWQKHWIDALIILVAAVVLALVGVIIYQRFNFETKIKIFYDYFVANNGYKKTLIGLKNTGIIALFGLLMGTVIGTLIAVIKVIPPYKKLTRYGHAVCNFYVALFRGTPIVVQLLTGYYIILPLLGLHLDPVLSCVLIFGMNSGAYISEIMRGGIQSVDPGQLEAARAVGLSFPVAMTRVVVPQAVKNILPTMGNELIALVKETAVVGYVGAIDITKSFQDLGSSSYEFMIPYLVMAAIYIVIVAAIAALIKLMERRLAKNERNK